MSRFCAVIGRFLWMFGGRAALPSSAPHTTPVKISGPLPPELLWNPDTPTTAPPTERSETLNASGVSLSGIDGEKELTTQDLEARELEEAEDPDPLGLFEEDDWEIVAAGWGEEVRNVYEEELRVGLAMIEEILWH